MGMSVCVEVGEFYVWVFENYMWECNRIKRVDVGESHLCNRIICVNVGYVFVSVRKMLCVSYIIIIISKLLYVSNISMSVRKLWLCVCE